MPRQKRERKRFSDVDCDLEIFAMDLREGLNVKNVTFEGCDCRVVDVGWNHFNFNRICLIFVIIVPTCDRHFGRGNSRT